MAPQPQPPRPARVYFDQLEVYQRTIAFVAWVSPLLDGLTKAGDVKDQLDRAATSMPLNLAEGNGKYSRKERCRYVDGATGSALECAAALDVLVAKGKLAAPEIQAGKEQLRSIVNMLMALMKSLGGRQYKKGPQLGYDQEHE